jgi:hypothetical protein
VRRIVREGEIFPRGYGIAWHRWDLGDAVCYPVPLNWVIAVALRVWWRLVAGPKWWRDIYRGTLRRLDDENDRLRQENFRLIYAREPEHWKHYLRPGDRVRFSKTLLEHLLAQCTKQPDIPEGATTMVGEFVAARRQAGSREVDLEFRAVREP